MHELSIGQSLVEAVLAELAKLGPERARLLRVRVAIGRLRQVVPESLEQAYAVLAKDTAAEGSSLEIRSVPITARCEACGQQGEMPADSFLCPSCGSARAEILGGRELYLEHLEVETDN